MDAIRFTLNGRSIEERSVPPTTTLLNYVRKDPATTGTKEGCAEGDCGACTVAVLDTEAKDGPAWRAVNSCLVLLPMLQGKTVVTVEGLADGRTLHPAQQALVDKLGSQCGYCTPGVVMSMFEATYRKDLDEPWKLDDQMCGNLCRCTGYRPIREATAQVGGSCPKDRFSGALAQAESHPMAVAYKSGAQEYYNPTTTQELSRILADKPHARLVCGGTDLSLEVTKKHVAHPCLVSTEGVRELHVLEKTATGIRLGGAATLSDVEAFTRDTCPPLHRMLRYFASRQIKNRATLGGNVCNASPIGDTPPVLLALNAVVTLQGAAGTREVPITEFFQSYRKTALQPGEFLAWVDIPALPEGARAAAYKVSKRRELDISAVAAAFVLVTDANDRVTHAALAYGGMAATPARARHTEKTLVGQAWNRSVLEAVLPQLQKDFTPLSDHRGSAWYRATVCQNLLRGFFEETRTNRLPTLPQRPSATVHLDAAGE